MTRAGSTTRRETAFALLRIPVLDRYLGSRFARIAVANTFVFAFVYALVDSLRQFEAFMERAADFGAFLGVAFAFYAYQFPILFCRLLGPAITMISAMFTVTTTARANELVPILAAGRSVRRALLPVIVLATGLAGLTFYLQESWIPGHRDEIRDAQSFGRGRGGIGNVIYSDGKGRLLLAVRRYRPTEQVGEGVFIRARRAPGERVYTAARMEWRQRRGEKGRWILRDGEVQEFGADGMLVPVPASPDGDSASRLSRPFRSLVLDQTDLIPQDLEADESQVAFLSLADLARKAAVSPERHRWRIKYLMRFVGPLNHLVLVIVGLSIALRMGTGNVYLGAVIAAVIAIAYFALQSVAVYLGNRGALSPELAAWLVPIVMSSAGLTIWTRLRS